MYLSNHLHVNVAISDNSFHKLFYFKAWISPDLVRFFKNLSVIAANSMKSVPKHPLFESF
jgi:hypothetical protein